MTQVAFGLFDWIDRSTTPLHQLYEERLRLLEMADTAGFYCYHLAEHHATPLGMAPSPALFLTAAAQRTRRIRLGPLVYPLPLYHPLRLIEEICMLDHLSGGRLELGVGRGVSPYEVGHFGVAPADTRAIFDEALAVVVAGLTHDRLTFAGRHYAYRDVPMELRPLQRPYPPLWYPTSNPDSVPYAARHGYNFVGVGPAGPVGQQVQTYWLTWKAHRNDPARLNGHVAEPKVAIMRQVVVADTDDEALATARSAHRTWFRSITKLWHEHADHHPDRLFGWDTAVQHETILFGAPGRVRAQMARLLEATGCNYVICAFAWGTLSPAQASRSLRLFVDEVMPAFSENAAPVAPPG
ncbi:MAG TPA: LLM class flavin-dependent oxidoreductase [Methylomirabilota bacterium]|jgi:alkanesulfonate monooxygenase SsuD/methylene tetrahydromethanopterin reductase-like flavin-dependent oxidoreductase (luciferase family)